MLLISIILIMLAAAYGLFRIFIQKKHFLNQLWVNRLGDSNAKIAGVVICLLMLAFGAYSLITLSNL